MATKKKTEEGAELTASAAIQPGIPPVMGMQQRTLKDAVRQVMDSRGWSLRGAENATGLQFNTIDRMVKGIQVETDSIVRFAQSVAPEGKEIDTVIEWLHLGGRSYIAQIMERAIAAPATAGVAGEYNELVSAYVSADQTHRRLAMQILLAGKDQPGKKALHN